MMWFRGRYFASCVLVLSVLLSAQTSYSALACEDFFKPSYDFLVVGAGPAGITIAANLKRNNPALRVLVVEKSEDIGGTFSKHGRFYRLVTSFRGEASPFPETVKRHLENVVSKTNVDVRLQTHFENFDDRWSANDVNPFRYNVRLSRGGDVRAKTIVFATGMEPDMLNGLSGQTREFIRKEAARADSRVFTFNEVIARDSKVKTQDRNLKAVAVVGSGIAAINLVDFLKNKTSANVHWFVHSETKIKERVTQLGARYAGLLKRGRAKRIAISEAALDDVSRIGTGYKIDGVTVDEIWLATGAKQPLISNFAAASAEAAAIPVFSDEGDVIARKVVLIGRPPQAIYIAGAASGASLLSASLPRATQLATQLAAPAGETTVSDAMKRAIVETVVSAGKISKTPEVVLMAGLPGSGKSTVADRISGEHVVVDPDRIRDLIPMYQSSFNADPKTAAVRWHQAAIQLQFPIVDRSLSENRDIIIDGTMRDTAFFKGLIERIRRDHPNYKVRLIYVSVGIDEAKRRVELRSRKTGRFVPDLDYVKLQDGISRSVETLSPLVDEFLILNP